MPCPHEERLALRDIENLLVDNYRFKKNRSLSTMRYSFRHLVEYFGNRAKVVTLDARIDEYVAHRREEGAADASIRIELALLDRGCRLAVKKKRLSPRSRPDIEKPAEDESKVRKGFFRREAVERMCEHLPSHIAASSFLFFCGRVGRRDEAGLLRGGSGPHAPSGTQQEQAPDEDTRRP